MPNHATLQEKRQPASIWIHLVEVTSYEVVNLPKSLPVPCTEEIRPQLAIFSGDLSLPKPLFKLRHTIYYHLACMSHPCRTTMAPTWPLQFHEGPKHVPLAVLSIQHISASSIGALNDHDMRSPLPHHRLILRYEGLQLVDSYFVPNRTNALE